MGCRRITRLFAALAVAFATLALPAVASAHPLGNFTINHYAGLTIGPDRVDLDVVIDMAEIPTFQERQTMDTDSDGSVSDEEVASWAPVACTTLRSSLHLERDGAVLALAGGSSSATFLPGAGGLSTLRLECASSASLSSPITSATSFAFRDESYAERIGWREIVATARGTILDTHGLPATSPSSRLTAYPADLIASPLDIRSATIEARLDPAAASAAPGPSAATATAAAPGPATAPGAVPGGVAAELPAIFREADLTPFVILASILTAIGIGAWHAITPGHGKTLMAAYLIGRRGTATHALGLGLSVAVSHTLGILILAMITLWAGSALPPDVVVRFLPVVAAVSIAVIGGWMLLTELRRRAARTHEHARTRGHEHDHGHHHDHDHDHGHDHEHDHGHDHVRPGDRRAEEDRHVDEPLAHRSSESVPGVHRHGGRSHSHLPADGSDLSWRGLFVLGLTGGLVPSASALFLLLGSIVAGRPAYGIVLVMAFGLGMATVMSGVGLGMVFARSRLDRMPRATSLGRLAAQVPLVAGVVVLALGSYLTWQAVAGAPVL
ncbi:MAG TPA: hypothetical protein VFI34_00210 [Candidatus Limnocylindrales bacterium]|nr:hypothetical protein [Candidatus Limnocylindrales bacterium]